MKCMVSVKTLKSGRIIHASQDGSREFFSLLVYIYTNNTALLFILIYKDNSKSLQDI